MRLFGWKVVGRLPDVPKFVAIGAPHTSNWDFPLALLTARVLKVRIRWIGKAGIFRFPWGLLMRWLGGIPSERTGSEGLVAAMSRAFAESDRMVLAIAPEGTRKAVPYWKSGFYRIAHGVGVPIVPVLIDGAKRELRVGEPLMPTGEVRADMDRLREFYSGAVGVKPGGIGPVVLQDE
jgi:1-acyl-sn-glycerol-3-phosphate acyltransferase